MQDISEGWENAELEDKLLFEKAYALAVDVHKNQTRDQGSPYITHIDGIIDIIENELGYNNYTYKILAALHDVLEDSLVIKFNDLKNMFGENIATMVQLLTKTKDLTVEQYLKRMEDYKYPYVVAFVKLVDSLHNVRSLYFILSSNSPKVEKYIIETETYYLPFAQKFDEEVYLLINHELDKIKTLLIKNNKALAYQYNKFHL